MPRLIQPAAHPNKLRQRWGAEIDDNVIALAWSPDGSLLAAASVSGPITLFDGKTGTVRAALKGHSFGTTALAFNADGKFLASAGQDGKARLWNPADGLELLTVAGGAGWVEHLTWTPARNLFATGAGKKLRLWNLDGTLLREYPDQAGTIAALAWKPGTEQLASAAYHSVSIFSLDDAKPLQQFTWQGSILSIAWSPDGSYIATGDQDSTVHFWIARTGKDLQMWGYPTKVRELAWDRTSRFLATGGGAVITIWDCGGKGPEGTKPQQLQGHEDLLTVLTWQKNADLLISGGADGKLIVWDMARGGRTVARGTIPQAVTGAVWSPDEKWFAIGGDGGMVKVLAVP